MTVMALIGFAALLIAAFGIRTLLHLHRTGTSAWLMPATPAARVGDTLFALGALGTCISPALAILDVLEPITPIDSVATDGVGATFLVVGSSIALAAQVQMGTAWRAGIDLSNDYPLVTRGAFRVVRNPFYLGICTASFGVSLIAPTALAFVATGALIIGCNIDVRLVEEPHLRRVHGREYETYAAATPRFLPALPVPPSNRNPCEDVASELETAEIDTDHARKARRQFDPVGHYARPEVLRLVVDREAKPAATFEPEQLPRAAPEDADH